MATGVVADSTEAVADSMEAGGFHNAPVGGFHGDRFHGGEFHSSVTVSLAI